MAGRGNRARALRRERQVHQLCRGREPVWQTAEAEERVRDAAGGCAGLEGPARTLQLRSDSTPSALWKQHSGCCSMVSSSSTPILFETPGVYCVWLERSLSHERPCAESESTAHQNSFTLFRGSPARTLQPCPIALNVSHLPPPSLSVPIPSPRDQPASAPCFA